MASAADGRRRHNPPTAVHHFSRLLQTPTKPPPTMTSPSKLQLPLLLRDALLTLESAQPDPHPRSLPSPSSSSSSVKSSSSLSGSSQPGSGFPSTVRISAGSGGGPAFVGQVFSMCDLSGTGLMAVSTHFDIPFLSQRTPEWLKKMFFAKRDQRGGSGGPVFRFFMDLGDAVSYVKRLNIPSGVVGACRLDIAYEHFKEKPHMFQFVPNERQVQEANKLLKAAGMRKKKVEGVPVFSARNLDIAIATRDGIKWYTPYFFDKSMLDNILEESVDQHFHSLIQTRDYQRRRDVVDDNLTAEAVEEMGESMWDPPEVQEMMDEMGHPGIPLSVVSKAAEIQLLYAVDRVLLGNRWLRKATGIQPKFPYIVDSFEKKSEASFLRARKPSPLISNSEFVEEAPSPCISEVERRTNSSNTQGPNFPFPFGDWLSNPWSKKHEKQQNPNESNMKKQRGEQDLMSSPFLPKITMVGISTGEPGRMSKATLKKTMDDLTKELDRLEQVNQSGSTCADDMVDERDPLFVANVGDYYSSVSKTGSSRWVRGGSDM